MPKITFQTCDVITFTCFLGHCTAKNKDSALKFCMRVVCMYLDDIYSVFWINEKFWILQATIFEKNNILNLCVKIQKI